MGTENQKQITVPSLSSMNALTISTGVTEDAVVLTLPISVNLIMFNPNQARMFAARLLNLADEVDGGKGVS